MAAHLKKRVYEDEHNLLLQQQQHEEISAKKLRLTKPSKSAALHVDLCKATSPADALQYLLQFARKPVEAESVEGVVRILLEHYYKLQLHERGLKLQQTIYTQACKLLTDDYEQVRSAAVQLTWVLSQLYPESIVPIPSSNEEIRLVDDAFGKICHMVSDGSWVVRVQAAKLLGSMLQVSSHFLEQTLDKKLMSDLRRKRTAHERAKELYSSGEFSSGRKWGDDAPKEEVDTGAVNLIESGACGAFVHGLEDEMYEVRIAAVEALCMLAQSSPSFAEKCLDFLVDMFNDEIEEDSSRDIREALHELLCCTNVSTKEGIHLALVELLKNLTKYPTDRDSIWKCLKFLGGRHPTLVLPLVPELLGTHPFFDTPEPDMDDPACILFILSVCLSNGQPDIAVLVFIFNAAKSCPTMPALFSDHTFRHYAYLRDSLSHLVPPLRLPGKKLASSPVSASLALQEDPSQEFLKQSLERVFNLQHLDPQGIQELLEFTIRDLQRFGELQSDLAGMADFSAAYLRCQLLLIKALQEKLWNVAAPLYLKQNALALAAAKQVRVEPLFGICEKFLQEVDSFQSSVLIVLGFSPLLSPGCHPLVLTNITLLFQVLYPDGQAQIIHPKPADFRNPGPGRHRLITQVYLSHTAWTEPCQIEVRLLLAYSSDRNKASTRFPRSMWGDSIELLPQSENAIEGTIPFSKPVKVYIMPKPARR
ncbi:hypothetical protein JD844_033607 [Phrynosoma platyrhinos]|uniref:Integrator complex subunit 4 n=1 Tax=Phrynosoma platyrhinos TaxID=52577 RepID=A0ABQ7T676_PHRPL|nr:hypothetical protein JD844_033607 [Phrynosoma platyrhinos]